MFNYIIHMAGHTLIQILRNKRITFVYDMYQINWMVLIPSHMRNVVGNHDGHLINTSPAVALNIFASLYISVQ